jgi:hypothetical protein
MVVEIALVVMETEEPLEVFAVPETERVSRRKDCVR